MDDKESNYIADMFREAAHKITQDYIETYGAHFGNIDDLDAAIAAALRDNWWHIEGRSVDLTANTADAIGATTCLGGWKWFGDYKTNGAPTGTYEIPFASDTKPLSRKRALKKIRRVMQKWVDPSLHEYTFTDAYKDIESILKRVRA